MLTIIFNNLKKIYGLNIYIYIWVVQKRHTLNSFLSNGLDSYRYQYIDMLFLQKKDSIVNKKYYTFCTAHIRF